MSLCIIINHYRIPNLLLKCLRSIYKCLHSIDFEVVVVDAGAEDSTRIRIFEEFKNQKNLQYLGFKQNVGYSRSVNQALKKARGDFLFIINADILVQNEKSVKALMDYLLTHPDVGLVGPQLLNVDRTKQQTFFREPSHLAILARRTAFGKTRWGRKVLEDYEYRKVFSGKPLAVDWLMGSCYMTTQQALSRVGFFDERFFLYFEDVDWARRFRQAGYKVVYFPKVQFIHYHVKLSKKHKGLSEIFTNKYTRIHIMSWFKYLLKWKKFGL